MPAKTLLGHTGDHARPATRRSKTFRMIAGAALLVLAGSTAPTLANAASSAPELKIGLRISAEADRSPSKALAGSTLDQASTPSAFIYVSDARIQRAQFWLDDPDHRGTPTNVETASPFDLKPALNKSWSRQVPLAKLAAGKHSVLARLQLKNGQIVWLGEAFWVKKPGTTTPPSTPTTPPAPPTTAPPTSTPTTPTKPTPSKPAATPSKPAATSGGGSSGGGATSGRPNASNTGVPAGTRLTNSGPLTVTQDGAVISGLNISGCVRVNATNVTIKNSKITCTQPVSAIVLNDGDTGLTVMDSEIDGAKKASTAVYGANGVTLLRLDIHNIQDGPRVYDNFTMKGSWVHDLYQPSSGYHVDGIQSLGAQNVVISGNSFEVYNASTARRMNSVFMMTTTVKPFLRNISFTGNYVNGGVCSINMAIPATGVSNVVFANNTFGPNSSVCTNVGLNRSGVTWASSNVWASTGKTVDR
jgi:hypothetical protein